MVFCTGVEGVDFGAEAGLPMFFTVLTREFKKFFAGWITFCWTTVGALFKAFCTGWIIFFLTLLAPSFKAFCTGWTIFFWKVLAPSFNAFCTAVVAPFDVFCDDEFPGLKSTARLIFGSVLFCENGLLQEAGSTKRPIGTLVRSVGVIRSVACSEGLS